MTATKPMRKRQAETAEEQPPVLPTKLTEQEVLSRLGAPHDLQGVDVHRYDSSRARVNIRRSLDKAAAEAYCRENKYDPSETARFLSNLTCSLAGTVTIITDSFYLRTNYDGSLRSDCEPIARKY